MTQKISRAQFCTETALVAGRFCFTSNLSPTERVARDQGVGGGKHDEAAGSLGYRLIQTPGETTHHGTTDKHSKFGNYGPAGRLDDVGKRRPDRDSKGARTPHSTGNGQEFVCDRPLAADIEKRFDVADHDSEMDGKASRRDDPAGYIVDQDEFVTGRVGVGQGMQRRVGREGFLQAANQLFVFFLDPDYGPRGADSLQGNLESSSNFRPVMNQKFLVFVKQRLAFGRINDEHFCPGGQFDRRGKARPARADHAVFRDEVFHGKRNHTPTLGGVLSEVIVVPLPRTQGPMLV